MERKEFAMNSLGRRAVFLSTIALMFYFLFPASYPVNAQVDLSITKSGPAGPVSAGNPITYTIEATVPDPASGVVVTDTMPGGVSFTVYTQYPCDPITGTVPVGSTQDIICTLAGLHQMITGTFPITIRTVLNTSRPGFITNTATIGGDQSDPNPRNNSDDVATAINQSSQIPTLGDWGMILMVVLLGMSAVFFTKKRRPV